MTQHRTDPPHNTTRWCAHVKTKTEFYIRGIYQWDEIDVPDLDRWLLNFPEEEGQYFAMRLLNRFIYYSERDVIQLLKHGINKVLLYSESTRWAKDSAFLMPSSEGLQRASKTIKNCIFVPLLHKNKPSESGNTLCRYLSRHLDIRDSQLWQPSQLGNIRNAKVVIVDDFVGSGQQMIDFWNLRKISGNRLADIATSNNLTVTYLCLVATKKGIERIQGETKNLTILPCETLGEEQRVFHPKSIYWNGEKEVKKAKRFLSNLCSEKDIRLLGWQGLDYALAFHHAIPNATLPLFYKNTATWKRLIKRRGQ